MTAMRAPDREIEVKLPFSSPGDALRLLGKLGARVVQPRTFEDNVVFDLPSASLKATDRLLRLRRVGSRAVLTYKAPVAGLHRHKIREETETEVGDPDAMESILHGLGYRPVYRYQKYRSTLELEGLEISVDETPLGCYVELEGEPKAIDRVAIRLGFAPESYVLSTYRQLQEAAAAERGETPGDLVFDRAGAP
jgi:adenylate cyclase class 2